MVLGFFKNMFLVTECTLVIVVIVLDGKDSRQWSDLEVIKCEGDDIQERVSIVQRLRDPCKPVTLV